MPYRAEISRTNPSLILLTIDQSGSMEDPFGSGPTGRSKADSLADALNRLLQNLVIKCTKSEGIRDYYHVGVIGYGETGVGPAFIGSLKGKDVVSISEIGNNPARVENRMKKIDDGTGGILEQAVKFPVWFDPIAKGGTPMCEALRRAKTIIYNWLTKHPGCYPPIIINISDGEATDGDILPIADELRSMRSEDGNVLLFNLNLSTSKHPPVEFPEHMTDLPDNFAKLLFNASSKLPDNMWTMVQSEGFIASENPRGFVFNADMVSVVRFLDIGTRPSNLR
jgi:hypothetical protein